MGSGGGGLFGHSAPRLAKHSPPLCPGPQGCSSVVTSAQCRRPPARRPHLAATRQGQLLAIWRRADSGADCWGLQVGRGQLGLGAHFVVSSLSGMGVFLGKWRRTRPWEPQQGAACPHSFYLAPRQLNIHRPCLVGPQTTAHGRKGTQPRTENNSWAGLSLVDGGVGRGWEAGAKVHACEHSQLLGTLLLSNQLQTSFISAGACPIKQRRALPLPGIFGWSEEQDTQG